MKTILRLSLLAAGLVMAAPNTAEALSFHYDLDTLYTGTSPANDPPWLRATFTDSASVSGTVELKLEVLNLAPGEFVKNWWFDIGSAEKLAGLQMEVLAREGDFQDPQLGDAANSGAGYKFDFSFDYYNPPSKRFDGTDSVTVRLSILDGALDVYDFYLQNSSGNTEGPLYTAAQINGISGGYSAHIADSPPSLPDSLPSLAAVFALAGLVLLAEIRRGARTLYAKQPVSDKYR